MKPKFWKYSFDISAEKVIIKRHLVEGNNINFLKAIKPLKHEIVDTLPISIPLEKYEAFRESYDYGAFSVSDRHEKVSLGIQTRLNQGMVNALRKELELKYPLLAVNG